MKMSLIDSPSTLKSCITDLVEWGIIEVLQWGKNDWTGATKVRFSCSFLNRPCTATEPQLYNSSTATVQQEYTNKTNKTGKTNTSKEFDLFWDHYGKKTGSKSNTLKEWNKLSKDDQQTAYDRIDHYKANRPDPQFRKDPERYLKHRVWENEFDVAPKSTDTISSSANLATNRPQPISSPKGLAALNLQL
ncbi:hypothetical protein GO755_40650 [Spirosoma sp. HMF4905]|uniref:Uncharacterized protein n=2 Tax=Spirosoma arboris TaxID=2682092 RepID=A0A7K1SRG7_9BACT|nr:hypothetical protein [Spirosoma arboris]